MYSGSTLKEPDLVEPVELEGELRNILYIFCLASLTRGLVRSNRKRVAFMVCVGMRKSVGVQESCLLNVRLVWMSLQNDCRFVFWVSVFLEICELSWELLSYHGYCNIVYI